MKGKGGAREREMYNEGEARHERERAAAPDGEHREIKRVVLVCDLYTHASSPPSFESGRADKHSKMGHGPLGCLRPLSVTIQLHSGSDLVRPS